MSDPQFLHAAREKDYGCSPVGVEAANRTGKGVFKNSPVRLFLIFSLVLCLCGPAGAQQITEQGRMLIQLLDSTQVEQLWLPHRKVLWRTGQPTGEPVNDMKPHSHCSAFVAAAAERLGIYILRPPEHSTVRLANAQADWLAGQGKDNGWQAVPTPEEAQRSANSGMLVVAVYKETYPGRSGHIAIVRPSLKTLRLIQEVGPQITQAGLENHASTSLKEGFKHHKRAWKDRKVRFYSHVVNWKVQF